MGLISKVVFEGRGAKGVSDSSYAFTMTRCCERVGVIDDELEDFYWNADTPSQSVSLFEDSGCPYCGTSPWSLHRIDDISQVPEHWRWACDEGPRPGSRRIRPLREHVEELLRYCERSNGGVPTFHERLYFEAGVPQANPNGQWVLRRNALKNTTEFSLRFDVLLSSGYDSIHLFACGVAEDTLLIGVEVPTSSTGASVGLTRVTYSGPKPTAAGTLDWGNCCIIEGDAPRT